MKLHKKMNEWRRAEQEERTKKKSRRFLCRWASRERQEGGEDELEETLTNIHTH